MKTYHAHLKLDFRLNLHGDTLKVSPQWKKSYALACKAKNLSRKIKNYTNTGKEKTFYIVTLT